jgi:hypothetical protein
LQFFSGFLFSGNLQEDDGSLAAADKGYFKFRVEDVYHHMKTSMTKDQLTELETCLQEKAIKSGYARNSSKTVFSFLKESGRLIVKAAMQKYKKGNNEEGCLFSESITRKRKGFRREEKLFVKASFLGKQKRRKTSGDVFEYLS